MNYLPILSLILLILFSCSQRSNEQTETVPSVLDSNVVSSSETVLNKLAQNDIMYTRAKFVNFVLGDAEHYTFETESGDEIDFDGCEIENFNFGIELDESMINDQNQGWGPNTTLQGKWFNLTYFTREQPAYIDGPMRTARIINKAVLDDSNSNSLESIETPNSFKVLGGAEGDLDGDELSEKVIVYDTGEEADFGTKRTIYIYKNRSGTWTLWKKSTGAILSSEQGGVMGDPFEGVSIERNCIVINHFGGSRQKWNYTHRFRFQSGIFQLIGAKVNSGAPCDYFESFDYNLSTGQLIYEKETEDCANDTSKTEAREIILKSEPLPSMDGFSPGSNKIDLANSDVTVYF